MQEITRLSDRIEEKDGQFFAVRRYGLWGITAEVERRGRENWVVIEGKKETKFKTKLDAEVYMNELFDNRR